MRLIGMLDSPYVRRVAVSLQLLGLRFVHEPLSVFRTFEQFAAINPIVKAPTLVCDDGTVLMDSSLILEYAEVLATGTRRLLPAELAPRRRALRHDRPRPRRVREERSDHLREHAPGREAA